MILKRMKKNNNKKLGVYFQKMNEDYYKEKFEDLEREHKALEKISGSKSITIGWLIALIIFLLIVTIISVANTGGQTIIQEGYTIEQVTNATIQMCTALR